MPDEAETPPDAPDASEPDASEPPSSVSPARRVGKRARWLAWLAVLVPWLLLGLFIALRSPSTDETTTATTGPTTPPPLAAGTGSLAVHVVDADGAPLEGAIVEVRLPDGAEGRAEALTSAHGAATIDELADGLFHVFATSGDLARGFAVARVADGTGTAELVLGPGRALTGVVVDTEASPIANARIEAVPVEDETLPAWEARTDAEGAFALDNLVAAAQRLRVSAEGYDGTDVRVEERTDEMRLVLQRIGTITGVVRRADGAGAEGAEVLLAGSGVWPPRRVTADGEGRFRFPSVPQGIYEVRARRAEEVADPLEGLFLAPGGTLDLTLTLAPGRTLQGVVVVRDGTPIADAEIVVGEQALSLAPTFARTDAQGHFRVGGLRAVPHRVSVHADGFVSVNGQMHAPAGEPLRFVLEAAAVVSGTVVDDNDMPIEGARVEIVGTAASGEPVAFTGAALGLAMWGEGDDDAPPASVAAARLGELGVTEGNVPPIPLDAVSSLLPTEGSAGTAIDMGNVSLDSAILTDARGHFEARGVPPGRLQVLASHPSYAPGIGQVFSVASGGTKSDIVVRMPEGGAIAGRVVDGRGFPVPHIRVEMACERESFPRATLSREDGTFDFEGAFGATVLTAYPAGLPAARTTVTVEAGDRLEVELVMSNELATLYARVVDDRGFPIAGARVHVRSLRASQPMHRTAFSADDGTLEIGGLPLPPWRIEADHESYASETLARVTETEGERRITLHPAARVAGRVLDDWEGSPLENVEVTLRIADGDVLGSSRSGADGIFELLRVRAGNYTLTVAAPGFVSGVHDARVAARGLAVEDADVGEIRLAPAGSIAGMVLDPLGELVPHAEVALGSPPAWATAVRSDAEGRFTITGVPEGEVSLTARHAAAGVSNAIPIRVHTREETSAVLLRLPERYDESRITDDTGGRHVGVAVGLRDASGGVRVTAVRADSAAAAAGVHRGDILLVVDDEAVTSAAHAETLLRGPAGVEVVLEVARGTRTILVPVEREAWTD